MGARAERPLYELAMNPESIEAAVQHLEVTRSLTGEYVVSNPRGLPGIPSRVAAGATPKEAIGNARKVVEESRRMMVEEEDHVRRVLLRGLRVHLTDQEWRLGQRDFTAFLRRAKERGYGVLGIEAWRGREFLGVRTFENYARNPMDAKWYFKAFDELKTKSGRAQFSATVRLPDSVLARLRMRKVRRPLQ